MKSLLHVFKYVIPYKWYALLNILFNIFLAIFNLASLTFLIPILNILFKTKDVPDIAGVSEITDIKIWNITALIKARLYPYVEEMVEIHGGVKVLMYISVFVVIVFFLKNVSRYFAMFFLAPIRNGVVRDFRNNLYKKTLILPLSYFSEQKKGDVIARMTSDVQEIEWAIMSSLEMLFREPITIIIMLAYLMGISPQLTIFVFILLPLSGLFIAQIGKSLRRTSKRGQKQLGILMSNIEETLGGLRIIKAFTAINSSDEKFRKQNQTYTRTMIRLYRKRDLASPLSEMLSSIVLVVVLWYGGRMVLTNDSFSSLDGALFITYILVFSQIITPAKQITRAYYNVQKGAASVERIQEVLTAEEKIVEKEKPVPAENFENAIEYKNVSFAYEKTKVLTSINLKIEKGKTIALVGSSGGGKSTMVDLLPRFYDCIEGGIYLDGTDIRDLVIDDLRSLMGIVSQESILFNDTVMGNIALGMENVNEEDVIAAAKVANAHEFISQMPEGYMTNIGDRGVKLSGGQRQRISIARAVLKNPPILILDEATSALDTESEKLVQDALINLMKNRTSIVIAHRLSTIQHADEIVVLGKGEILERGKHKELLALNGVYKKLCDLQSFA